MNVVIGVYIYKVLKDPENYKKDPPLVIKPKKNDWYDVVISIHNESYQSLFSVPVHKCLQTLEKRVVKWLFSACEQS